MRAVLPANGRDNVTLYLLWCEPAWSPGSLGMSQRVSSAIPALMPAADNFSTAGYSVAMRECSKVMSGGAWRVLEEDLMLLLWRELLHVGLSGGVVKTVRFSVLFLCIEISALAGFAQALSKTEQEVKARWSCMNRRRHSLHMLHKLVRIALLLTRGKCSAEAYFNFGQCCTFVHDCKCMNLDGNANTVWALVFECRRRESMHVKSKRTRDEK